MSTTNIGNPGFVATGNHLVVLDDEQPAVVRKAFARACGLAYLSTADNLKSTDVAAEVNGSLVHFSELGVALVRGDDEQIAMASGLVSTIEPEGHMFLAPPPTPADVPEDECEREEDRATWGLQDTGVPYSRFTGKGIKVAVLDSGIVPGHPAFARKAGSEELICKPFFDDKPMSDEQGHGSHCAGILFGADVTPDQPRFGVAQSSIGYVARIFREDTIPGVCGSPDFDVLHALNWAIGEGCAVVSMSFGRRPLCSGAYSRAYEAVARRALERGTLLIAAAGNDSERFDDGSVVAPVHEPANCPSIMAVGGIDNCGRLTFNSNGGGTRAAAMVDMCGPGASILSAWLEPLWFRRLHGTSVATPFVAAIAALYAEACGVRGRHLWSLMRQKAVPLFNEKREDTGAGLVRAPLDYNY